ncbi:MAG: radical SAM protein [Phycisphaerales bacterium]|nr:MAG: radical SAM protein [Phycisphaerales bacterium]
MHVVAVLIADLETTPLGTRSRLEDLLAGVPVLRRTVDRVAAATALDGIVVLAPSAQLERAVALLAGTPARVSPHDAPPTPWAGLVRTARKWSLDGWRGGVGGTSSLDEYVHPTLIAALIRERPCDAVAVVPPAAPCLDPAILDEMIRLHARQRGESRLTFTQAPPGVTGVLYEASLIAELAEKNIPPGWVISYKPDAPAKDLALMSCCFQAPAALTHAVGRLIADTDTAWDRLTSLFAAGVPLDPASIARGLDGFEQTFVPPVPHEVEIELTTDDPYPDAVLRPRGGRVGDRGEIRVGVVEQIARELAQRDDSLIVLGGCGDPLCHPKFVEILRRIRRHGVYGVAVRTTGLGLSDAVVDALMDHQVDVLEVQIDGWTPPTYAAMTSAADPARADLAALIDRIDRLDSRRRERLSPAPIVVPQMVKARQTVQELRDFYDGWLRRNGAVGIVGYSHCGGQLESHAVMSMAPPTREPCRRLGSRCVVLADGRVTLCDQDIRGVLAVGRLGMHGQDGLNGLDGPDGPADPADLKGGDTLARLWRGARWEAVRRAHQAPSLAELPLCPRCDEWHRP